MRQCDLCPYELLSVWAERCERCGRLVCRKCQELHEETCTEPERFRKEHKEYYKP